MNIVLISGGEGKRLWPLSNCKPKQFLELLETSEGVKESMLQHTYRMLNFLADITISASCGMWRQSAFWATEMQSRIPMLNSA